MATETDGEAKGCTFRWKIENISHFWWSRKGTRIKSPTFVADALEGTKWSLWLYPMGYEDESFIAYFLKREKDCNGPDTLEVNFQLAFLDSDGSILTERTPFRYKFSKNTGWGSTKFVGRERVFVSEKDAFMPEDTLNVQCCIYTIGEKPAKTNRIFATTVIKVKRRSFVWRIDKFSTLKSCIRHIFKDYLIVFDLVLNEGFDKLYMHMTSFDDSIKYISRKTSIIDSEGGKKNCEIKKYFEADLKKRVLPSTLLLPKMLMENKSLYLPNDVLSFDFELVISTFEHFNCEKKSAKLKNEVAGKEKSHKTAVLIKYYKSLYNDSFFSDMELRTSTKTFPIHKAILSYKSPVFRNMFSHEMKEKNRRYMDITDFEDDTVHRMLQYIYTDSLEDLQFESASKLYKIADKYEILSLKSECSSFLRDNLCPENACDILVLADLHNDDYLQRAVQDYILRHRKQIFCSREWKDLMRTHLELAACIMYKKFTKSDLYLPRGE